MPQDKQLFMDISQHLMTDEKPSIYLEMISETKEFKDSVFDIMNKQKVTMQPKKYHPEGNVWIHTNMVVDEATKYRDRSKNALAFMWAAFLHDIGKPFVTKIQKDKITAYNHDRVGAIKAEELLCEVTDDYELIQQVVALVRWHMQILYVAKNPSLRELEKMKKEVDVEEVGLLGFCDRSGRLNVNTEEIKEDIQRFLVAAGYTGAL